MTKIPAFREMDHGSRRPYPSDDDDDDEDIELLSCRWAVRLCDSNHTIESIGM